MPTNAKTKTKRATARKSKPNADPRASRPQATNAIELLKQDHREVEEMFEEYEDIREGGDEAMKKQLAQKICTALKVHTQLEEQIFYPAAREATGDYELLDEAMVEHAGAKNLIAEIEAMDPADDLYDAKIRVLGEQIRHHVEEEEEELFPEVEDSDMDVVAVGEQLAARKAVLTKEMA